MENDCFIEDFCPLEVLPSTITNINSFDSVIGHIEDILVNDKFVEMISTFMEKYWFIFENIEDNKLVYTEIFNMYTNMVESFIESYLIERIKDFSMSRFLSELLAQKNKLDGEVYDVLLSMSDFLLFKEMMLDYRNMKEGLVADFSSGMHIKKLG